MSNFSVEHASFTIERRLDAAPAEVFAAWAEPAAKRRWLAEADGWQDIEHRLDFRAGGSEYAAGRLPGGPLHVNETVFLNIVPGRRIVFAYTMRLDDKPLSASLATVTLQPDRGGTRLVYTEQVAFFEGRDDVESRRGGWAWLLGQMETVVAGKVAEPA